MQLLQAIECIVHSLQIQYYQRISFSILRTFIYKITLKIFNQISILVYSLSILVLYIMYCLTTVSARHLSESIKLIVSCVFTTTEFKSVHPIIICSIDSPFTSSNSSNHNLIFLGSSLLLLIPLISILSSCCHLSLKKNSCPLSSIPL